VKFPLANIVTFMDNKLIEQLWREHNLAAFPQDYRGKDVNGRLELLAELVLKAVAISNQKSHESG
jgi:hypothetical protein